MRESQFQPFRMFQDGEQVQRQHRDEQRWIADQDTMPVPTVNGEKTNVPSSLSHNGTLLANAHQLMRTGLRRLQEPQPEGLSTRGLQRVKADTGLGLFPLLTFTNASGLFLIALAYYASVLRYGTLALEMPFLIGLLLMFVPNLVRLLSPKPSRLERLYLLCVLGIYFYAVEFMISPHYFSSFDESLHMRTLENLLRFNHLFSLNTMLPVSPYYPGLEIVTDAISTTTGLSPFLSGVTLIIAARLLMVLSLFLLYEAITSSSRMAGIASLIYMINSHFIFFDTSFSYETLAIALAAFLFYILRRYQSAGKDHYWMLYTSWAVLLALTLTHHMTNYVTDGLLLLWSIMSIFLNSPRSVRIHLCITAILAIILSFSYTFFKGNPVWSYLTGYFNGAFTELGAIISGTSVPRPLFTTSAGPSAPIWDRLFMTASVGLTALSLPFGLITLWHQHRHEVLCVVLGVFAFVYPIVQVFRFTVFGVEIADRSTAFLFLAIALVLTLLITHFWPSRVLRWKSIMLIATVLSVIFLGDVMIASGPFYSSLPGPYEVVADGRSVEPEGIQAAIWMLDYLGPDNRVATDRINQMLMNTYGDQYVVTSLYNHIDVSPIFYATQLGPAEQTLIQQAKIHYLVVDLRLSTGLPVEGVYFEVDQNYVAQLKKPLPKASLTKFNTIPQMNRLFDSGDIVIYDTGVFGNAP